MKNGLFLVLVVVIVLLFAIFIPGSCKKTSSGGTPGTEEVPKNFCRVTLVNNTVTEATIVNVEWEEKGCSSENIAVNIRYCNSYKLDIPKKKMVKIILTDEQGYRYCATAAQNGYVRFDVDSAELKFEKKTNL